MFMIVATAVWAVALYLHIQAYNRYRQDLIEEYIGYMGFDEDFLWGWLDFYPIWAWQFGSYLVMLAFAIFIAWAWVLTIPKRARGIGIPRWMQILIVGMVALVWWLLSVIVSIIEWRVYDTGMFIGEYGIMTLYYTDAVVAFFPTHLTSVIVGEYATGYFEDMITNHIVAIPIYFAICYIVYFAVPFLIRRLRQVLRALRHVLGARLSTSTDASI